MSKQLAISALLALVLIVTIKLSLFSPPTYPPLPSPSVPTTDIFPASSYTAINPNHFQVSLIANHLQSPTRLKLLPDSNTLLVAELSGTVRAYKRTANFWSNQPNPVIDITTSFPGFPPKESGLTGIALSADFTHNHTLFLLYSKKDSKDQITNHVAKTQLQYIRNQWTSTPPEIIFTANTPSSAAHQIQDGLGIMIDNTPHLIFTIGDGFSTQAPQDPLAEAGKVILIKEDGTPATSSRLFPNPKVQALGIRNSFAIAQNPFDPDHRILLSDTGPDKFDRLIYTSLLPQPKPLNFDWDGTESSLATKLPDPNFPKVNDMALLKLPETRTFTGIAFHPGSKIAIPTSTATSQSVLLTVFGKTGWPDPSPGKEIWLARLTNISSQPQITYQPIIKRVPEATGKLGNPIGLEIDPTSGNFFFADIIEGRIYLVTVK